MTQDSVLVFRTCPLKVGQKIYIADGPRYGDWEVIGVGEHKVKLRCPVSKREFEWGRFCYFVEEEKGGPWPHPDR